MKNLEEILVVVFCSTNFLSSDSTLETTFLGLTKLPEVNYSTCDRNIFWISESKIVVASNIS